MNREELKKKLDEKGINPNAYSLDGGILSERYVLSDDGYGNWTVFYSERGMRINEKIFNTEDEACFFLLKELLSDPTVVMV